jgi:hypothetical protein
VEVFSNSLFRGVVSETVADAVTPIPVFSGTSNVGAVIAGADVHVGMAPASAFGLDVNGQAAPRVASGSWTSIFHVSATASGGGGHSVGPTGQLILRRPPFNALIGAFTLLLWLLAWLGFGWVHRLEWLFTGRRKASRPRHAKEPDE